MRSIVVKPDSKKTRGFTLIEVLVVVTIIALLIAVLLPSLSNARQQTREVICRTHLRELYRGHALYAADNKGRFPHYDWWLWDNNSGFREPQINFFPDLYAKWGGSRPTDSSLWVEFGHIYKYIKAKEVYFCPNDTKQRLRGGAAIGGGINGNTPIHSFARLFEPHALALWKDTGDPNAWPNDGRLMSSDFLSPDRLTARGLMTSPPLPTPPSQFGPFSTSPDRVALMYEEYSGTDEILKSADPSNAANQLGDGHSGFWCFPPDLAASRHRGRADFSYWDGHAAAIDATKWNGGAPGYSPRPNGYEFKMGLGGHE